MCKVQRVTNSCGHRNDHVLLVCHIAKAPSPPLSPHQSDFDSSDLSISDPAYNGLYERRHLIAWPIGDPRAPNSTETTTADNNPVNKGFHACTEPYCIYASIRELDSPKGFKCMVSGCGRAD